MGRRTRERYDVEIRQDVALEDIKKSNTLINAKGRATLLAQKLFVLGLRYARFSQEANTMTSTLYGTQLQEMFGLSGHSLYGCINDLVYPCEGRTTLTDWKIVYKDDEKQEIAVVNVVQSAVFKNGRLDIKYNSDLSKYMGDLMANYTILPLGEIMRLSSMYSFRMYEILKSKLDYRRAVTKTSGAVEWETDITELKLQIGIIDPTTSKDIIKALKRKEQDYEQIEDMIREPKYKLYGDLKRRVIDPAVEEINKETNLIVEYRPIKQGRAVKKLVFTIDSKDKQKQKTEGKQSVLSDDDKMEVISDARAMFDKSSFKMADVRKIVETADYDIDKIKQAHRAYTAASGVKNPVAWVITAIREGYDAPTNKTDAGFEQRDIDYNAIESILLE